MDSTKPIGNIKPQVLSNSIYVTQNVLFNDSVALFNDPVALFGGEDTPIEILKTSTSSNAPTVKIQPRR